MDFIATEGNSCFAALRRQLDIDRFILFGHSVGGGMAINCAEKFPEACVAVVVEFAQAFVEDQTIRGIEAARVAFKDSDQVDRLKKYYGAKAEWVLSAWINSWLDSASASWLIESVSPQVK